ncbi:DUF1702 family protein [Nocardia transvalensis]|uniref:DUF1702 family protein n=1 Tax=Nocardia transvalensis TaxID=37333 RepID=UPI00189454EF|nr:DUF1702 family protein [Nocardia transvalensis]MBF6329481.1 DUF1702 family protein [Nocardia transvalensis]
MPSPIGPLRSLLLGTRAVPDPLNRPHFAAPSPATAAELERVSLHLSQAIDFAVRSKNNDEVIAHLAGVPEQYQGFAYEGAATGLAVLDALTPGGHRAADMFSGPTAKHDLTMYVGVGLSYGRVPKPLWGKAFPKHPVYRWLTLDGFGFYNAFFRTEKYVIGRHVEQRFPRWMGNPEPLRRAADQGLGRALWFICGGSVELLAQRISQFEPHRHGDLWNGVGIATTFAGGVEAADLKAISELVPQFRADLAGGCAMVAKIREKTGTPTPHTEAAVNTYCGCSIGEAAALIDKALGEIPSDGSAASYQLWRQRVGELAVAQGN